MSKKKKENKDQIAKMNVEELKETFASKFGEGALMPLGDDFHIDCDSISTQSISIDHCTGIGGYPKGRIVEIIGPEASGKTTLAMHAVASAQQAGGKAAFIDAEHALDPKYAQNLGINLNDLLLSQPDSGEQALEMVELLVDSQVIDVIVVDSVAALVPRAELEGEVGDNVIGGQARMMSQFLRRLVSKAKKNGAIVIFINQIRHKIGVMFGNNETTPGGRALKFYASMRLDIRRIGAIKDGDDVIGHTARVKMIKNKLATPFKVCDIPIMYGEGINRCCELINIGCDLKIIEKSGSWLSYKEERIGNGQNQAVQFLKDNDNTRKEISDEINKKLFATEDETDEIGEMEEVKMDEGEENNDE